MKHHRISILSLMLCILLLQGCAQPYKEPSLAITDDTVSQAEIFIPEQTQYPAYTGEAHTAVNGNIPFFTKEEQTDQTYESYSDLDELGRPGIATACLGTDTMPAENEWRGAIGMIKPAGWHTVKYPDIIPDSYLYNRCHLIGWQLSGENANERNLITGTRYLNVTGMLPFENQIADYIKDTGNHVMYRVTPVYTGNNLLCDGLLLEAMSVEDNGLSFCVYCHNVQPDIIIDYATGDSRADNEAADGTLKLETDDTTDYVGQTTYILNTSSMKIHTPECPSAAKIADHNKKEHNGKMSTLLSDGYTACRQCLPE